jgi:hypothetical protein
MTSVLCLREPLLYTMHNYVTACIRAVYIYNNLFNDALLVSEDCMASNDWIISEWWIPCIYLDSLRKPQKTSVGLAGLQTEIWIWDLSNTKQGC